MSIASAQVRPNAMDCVDHNAWTASLGSPDFGRWLYIHMLP